MDNGSTNCEKRLHLKKKINYTLRAKVAKVRQKSAVICR